MILYIAGPMSNLPEFNYPAFNTAERTLTAAGFEVLNPTPGEPAPSVEDAHPWDWYMRRSLAQVLQADGIALLDGWNASRGARLEYAVAHGLELPTGTVDEWVNGGVN